MSKENEAVILSAVRTPIGRFQGGLSSVPATKVESRVFVGFIIILRLLFELELF